MKSPARNAIIFIDSFLSLEYRHKRAIIDLYDDAGNLFSDPLKAAEYLKINSKESTASAFVAAIRGDFLKNLAVKCEKSGVTVITEADDDYPDRLINLPFRPLCLYCKGNVKLLKSKETFGIVGSRKTLAEYKKYSENVARTLLSSGVTLVTGTAAGGDFAAIKEGYKSGKLICVLAEGFDFIGNEINRDYLFKTIENDGLVVSEYPPSVPPQKYHYPVRNRIIAGLSDGVLITSGEDGSGARHTANYALEYGKEIFSFPYAPLVKSGELCNSLIKEGANLVTDVKDILSGMNLTAENKEIILSDTEKQVYDAIKNGAFDFDTILDATGLKVYALTPIITSLEIKGAITRASGGGYAVSEL